MQSGCDQVLDQAPSVARPRCVAAMAPKPTVSAYCIEAARAAALASHSAASLCAAAGLRKAARLLRAPEALARAATASLLSPTARSEEVAPTTASAAKRRQRRRKKSMKQSTNESVMLDVPDLPAALSLAGAKLVPAAAAAQSSTRARGLPLSREEPTALA